MPSKKIAVLLHSSIENTALLEYAGCCAKNINAKLCIISTSPKTNKQSALPGMKHKLRLIESINDIFKSQPLSFEIIITTSQNTKSLASFFKEHDFSRIIINEANKELTHTFAKQYHLPIVIFKQYKTDSNNCCSNPLLNKA
ncbi:hypothetical protein J1N10_05970 [Carboxylicivirga sp. A043]|uniref:hypothetical protein n=1 Tax=Carboxylicivirga litoralis TaxID=2816963 RepID=UPI0021CAF0CE|nr:hypothetical protein [Carboxylicivirga sp. A043]MCU4155514.1 hypothetical protein [Carboxylicivirga sp. A043]